MELACNVFIDKSFLIHRAGRIQSPDRLHEILVPGEGSGSRPWHVYDCKTPFSLQAFKPLCRCVFGVGC